MEGLSLRVGMLSKFSVSKRGKLSYGSQASVGPVEFLIIPF